MALGRVGSSCQAALGQILGEGLQKFLNPRESHVFLLGMVCLLSLVSGVVMAISQNCLNKIKHWGCSMGLTEDWGRGSLLGNFARN